MAEEVKASAFDAALDSIVGFIHGLLFPKKKKAPGFLDRWFNIHGWVDAAGGWGISRGFFIVGIYVPLLVTASNMMPELPRLIAGWVFFALPVAGPIGMGMGFWAAWIWYIQSNYIYSRTKPVLLEVKMPTEITKSPRAMEQVFTSVWTRSGTTTFIDRNWHGGCTPYTSFEICSFGGEIHFFIWARRTYKNVIEAAMYSQYPEVEIVEVEDYASRFEYDTNKHSCFVTDYVYANDHQKGGPADVYPIKTYVDFELDKDPKEEHMVDPYGSVLEVLSALNKDEQAWIQIVIRGYFKKDWLKAVHKEVEQIRYDASKTEEVDEQGHKKERIGFPRPTEVQKEQMQAMERQLAKLTFEVGMRGIYIAPRGKMRSGEFTAVRWIWRPFNNPLFLNQIRPRRAHNDFDYLWQDWNGVRYDLTTRRYFDMYRRRLFFHSPWQMLDDANNTHMSTEVLATLWHPPSTIVKPPGLQRIPVAKSEAPSNLPI
jgi:hypothetical protein